MGYEKTTFGRQALQTREIRLSPCQRAIFIMANGERSLAELLKTALSMGGNQADIDQLVTLGMLELASPEALTTPSVQSEVLDIGLVSDWENTESAGLAAVSPATELAPAGAVAQRESISPAEMVLQARSLLLELITPLGLRQTHLRRALEDADSAVALRELLPMVEAATQGNESVELSRATALLSWP